MSNLKILNLQVNQLSDVLPVQGKGIYSSFIFTSIHHFSQPKVPNYDLIWAAKIQCFIYRIKIH